ncbi:hypothetical protein [Nafulsella turpanensis]|uniref:hypothetical protein n=1 Tax=Nafulsella turpanensis TaxID=1265690 RepID=UPI00034ACD9B|nr:hypothetical protein [Nafulsella turpanensis]
MVKIQKVLTGFIDIILSLFKVVILSKFKVYIPAQDGDELFILGNGPSLNFTLQENLEKLQSGTTLAVNNFAYSDFFVKIKPSFYVLVAPEYFMSVPPTENHIFLRNRLFNILTTKVTWPITLFIPTLAEKYPEWKKVLSENKNIKFQYFNSTPVEGPEWFAHKMFALNLGMPRPHNVLVPSIFVGINMRYKKIFLFGADHSWHEEIKVSEFNQMTVNHGHFYDKDDQRGKMHKLDGKEFHIHDVFRKLYLAFKGYFILASYAKKRGVYIVNASHRSYIDAFERVKI